jgi:hypothetical protein
MIIPAQSGWHVLLHEVREAEAGSPLRFFQWPIVAWRNENDALLPMTFGCLHRQNAVVDPDGKVSSRFGACLERTEYERKVIEASDEAKAELRRRENEKERVRYEHEYAARLAQAKANR